MSTPKNGGAKDNTGKKNKADRHKSRAHTKNLTHIQTLYWPTHLHTCTFAHLHICILAHLNTGTFEY